MAKVVAMKRISPKLFIIAAILAAIFLPPFAKYQELKLKNSGLENRIRELKEETKRLEAEKKRLQTDITYVEKRAREKIGVVRKGEIVVKEVPANSNKK